MTSWSRGCDDFVSGRRSADVVVYCTCTARGLGGVAGSSPVAQWAVGRLRRWMRVKCCVCLTACSFRNYAEFVTRSCWFCAPSSGEVSVRPSSCSVPRMAAWMKRESRICVAACCVTDDEPARPLLAHIGGLPAVSAPLNIAVFQWDFDVFRPHAVLTDVCKWRRRRSYCRNDRTGRSWSVRARRSTSAVVTYGRRARQSSLAAYMIDSRLPAWQPLAGRIQTRTDR